jgi:hypothetical protein
MVVEMKTIINSPIWTMQSTTLSEGWRHHMIQPQMISKYIAGDKCSSTLLDNNSASNNLAT